jgi:heme exporter protein A
MTLASAPEGNIGMTAMTAANALPPALLEAEDLSISRGGRLLIDRMSIRVGAWETVLIRGPNGAGKSSLLLALAGTLRPDTGRISWPEADDRPQLHFLGHLTGVKARLTLAENLRFWRALNGPSGLEADAALERVGLGGLGDIEAGHLSAGQTRRLGLARLLVSTRPVWLLDEPTASLDAAGQALVGELLQEHASQRGGAIVATHDDIPGTAGSPVRTLGAP